LKALGFTNKDICNKLQLPLAHTSLDWIYQRALDRGFTPEKPVCLNHYIENAPRSGRPTKQTEQAKADVEAKVRRDRYGREKSAEVIAAEVGLSKTTVEAILKKAGYKKTKPTRKPGLTEEMKKARLEFCRAHVDKGDDFWHNIIWTDETSIILGHR
jgi:transposase